MQTLSIMNLKGGVGKTVSSINIAHILTTVYGAKVLLVDNDKQGNTSKFLNRHDYKHTGMAEIMTEEEPDTKRIIQHTDFEKLDVITANMKLYKANLDVQFDEKRPQQTRLKEALEQVQGDYDFCIIDNAPDINVSTINALVASDDVIIPVTIDDFSIDGLEELKEQIENTQKGMNPDLYFMGCFITQFDRTNEADVQGEDFLQKQDYNLFRTHIRKTVKMKQSTFARIPIIEYSSRCAAALDYKKFVEEYLQRLNEM